MSFYYTPYTLALTLAALVSVMVAWTIWQRRPGPGVIPSVLLMLGVAVWTLAYVFELGLTDLQGKILFANLKYIGITTTPAAWAMFAAAYTGRTTWFTRRKIALLFIEPIAILALALTDDYHHLFRTGVGLDWSSGFPILIANMQIAFWIHAIYSYILMLIGTLITLQALTRSPHLYRGQAAMLLIASFAPWIANIIFLTGLSPFPLLDLTPFAFAITGLAMGMSLVRFRLLDLVPVARDTVIESMSDGILVLDALNRIVDVNLAILDLIDAKSAAEVIGKPAGQVLARYQSLLEQYRSVDQAQAEIAFERGGQTRFFELRISPLRNRHGELTGRLVIAHDISELKAAAEQIKAQNDVLLRTNRELADAQKQAEEASRLKSEFLATMSHELRTPLNAIIGYTDIMLTGLTGALNETQADYSSRILANGERLLTLINDILDIAKIEASRLDIEHVPFHPAELLHGVDNRIRSLAVQKGLGFVTQLDPALPPALLGDPHRLEQILANLISNAIRFTSTGEIAVQFAKLDDAKWSLSVRDTGVGIPPHALEYIFDEFRQVDGSSQRAHGGTGLGLAIVRKLTMLMGGTIQVQSEVGKGSIFTVQLPLVAAGEPVVEALVA
ncbi:MAG: PAS domain-containing protein [Anaerolineae bacterium]|nr:PAS domain-containing protein [Anaerolineae bacterium]